MPSLQELLSRKSDAEPVAAPPWHPNFRNYERLPDTKVVRTTFFINAVAISLAAGMIIWAGSREMALQEIGSQISESQRQINDGKVRNDEGLRLSAEFASYEKRLGDARKFIAPFMSPVKFIETIGQTLPEDIVIDNVDLRYTDSGGPTFILRGAATGTPDQASGVVSSYGEIFRTNPVFAAAVDKAEITNVNRNPSNGTLSFEIILRLKPEPQGRKS